MMSQIQAMQASQAESREKILEDVRSEFRFEKAKLMTEMERFIIDKKKSFKEDHLPVQQSESAAVSMDQSAAVLNDQPLPPDFMKTSQLNKVEERNSRPSSNQILKAERNLLNILNQALDPNEPFGPPLIRSADKSASDVSSSDESSNYELDISQMTDKEFKAELTRQYLIKKLMSEAKGRPET